MFIRFDRIYTVFQKHVTTFLMISCPFTKIFSTLITKVIDHRLSDGPSIGIFNFLPHLLRAATLPWETVKT